MRSENKDTKKVLIWIITVALSALLIIFGNRIAAKDISIMSNDQSAARAKVIELTFEVEDNDDANGYYSKYQYFNALILTGDHKGETVQCYQHSNSYSGTDERFIKPGDRVILYNYTIGDGPAQWVFGSYARFDSIFILGIIYLVLLVVLGRKKGINTIISLAFTCLAVFFVFLPAVISGKNIYVMTVAVCIYIIVMTLLITNGASRKSLTTMLGCGAGVLCAALLSVVFDRIMHLTGVIDEHSVYISVINTEGRGIDLRALIFAMITIGALGAVMDVAMDIASSLYEIRYHAPEISRHDLFKSGLNIGRDVMGTMANTLILAYIGSSLCTIILRVAYAGSMMELLNTESIVVELLQAISGSLGILLTIPLTAFLSCMVYCRRKNNTEGQANIK